MTTEFTKNIELIQKLKQTYINAGVQGYEGQSFLGAAVQFIMNHDSLDESEKYLDQVIKMAFTDGFLSAVSCYDETVHPLDIEHHFANFKDLFGPTRWDSDFCKCGMFHMNCSCDGPLSEPLPEIGGMKGEVKLELNHDFDRAPQYTVQADGKGGLKFVPLEVPDLNEGLKKLMVEIEDLKRLVLNERVEITGTPAEDASGLFGKFQEMEIAPGVRDPSRCSLRACGCADKCRHPKDCQGAKAPEVHKTPEYKCKVLRLLRQGTRTEWENHHVRFDAISGQDAWDNFINMCLEHGKYEFKLVLSDDDLTWFEYKGSPLVKSELWAANVGPIAIYRRQNESESVFIDRLITRLNEMRRDNHLDDIVFKAGTPFIVALCLNVADVDRQMKEPVPQLVTELTFTTRAERNLLRSFQIDGFRARIWDPNKESHDSFLVQSMDWLTNYRNKAMLKWPALTQHPGERNQDFVIRMVTDINARVRSQFNV